MRSAFSAAAVALTTTLLILTAASCEDLTEAERCEAVEERLSAEIHALSGACRSASDCHPVQMHCKARWAAGEAPPVSITRLSKQFEDLGCCGSDEAWDGFTPKVEAEVHCGDQADDGGGTCYVTDSVSCLAVCQVVDACPEHDADGWSGHDEGCVAGCAEALDGHPARTRRVMDCIATQGCSNAGICG